MSSSAATPLAKPSGIAIVVEDSKPNAVALVMMLKKLGFEVIEYEDGLKAWNALSSMPAGEIAKIKIIFSDVMMPNLDGVELLRKVRTRGDFSSIPFVFCSALTDPNLVRETKALSSHGFVVKPVTFSRIQQKLSAIFPGQFTT